MCGLGPVDVGQIATASLCSPEQRLGSKIRTATAYIYCINLYAQ
jgi:hypothetical protein